MSTKTSPTPAAPGAARRLLDYLLAKCGEEPVQHRAALYEDLAAFVPDERVARHLLAQARVLRQADQQTQVLRLALQTPPPRDAGARG